MRQSSVQQQALTRAQSLRSSSLHPFPPLFFLLILFRLFPCRRRTSVRYPFSSRHTLSSDLTPALDDVKRAHLEELFSEAMDLRMNNPKKAQKLLEEVIKYDPRHVEARLKLSWCLLKMNSFKYDYDALLMPVAKSDEANLDQKQRAYTNLSCAIAFNPKDTRYEKVCLFHSLITKRILNFIFYYSPAPPFPCSSDQPTVSMCAHSSFRPRTTPKLESISMESERIGFGKILEMHFGSVYFLLPPSTLVPHLASASRQT